MRTLNCRERIVPKGTIFMPTKKELKILTMQSLLKSEIPKTKAAEILDCSARTIERYRLKFLEQGEAGLIDHRSSNNYKLTPEQKTAAIDLKKKDFWRSARNIRDHLKLPVHERWVQEIFVKEELNKQNISRVKPVQRFEAKYPNELWQADIMGRITFPHVCTLYLIGVIDDHSRVCLSARFFKTQSKINVFAVWYYALARYGIPNNMLHDKGSQYKAKTLFGKADYQRYAERLGIHLIWALKAQTKGKIERFWRFVQDDFVRSVWDAKTEREINKEFQKWLKWYNHEFRSRYFNNQTHMEKYHSSERKLTKLELIKQLTIEERRKVTRESTISLYGKHYYVPKGYIGCRIWVKIVGNKLYFEANDEIFWKTNLRF